VQSVRLLVVAGSSRTGSWNRKLADVAARVAEADGARVSTLDLRDLALPIYDGDLEATSGVPAGAARLRAAIVAADALWIVTPEYNGFPPPLLINAFDWLTRLKAQGDAPSGLATLAGKPVALMSASPGPLGGLRSMNFLRQYLQMTLAMVVSPPQYALGRADDAFDDAGELKDATAQRAVANVWAGVARLARALAVAPPRGP
jgi:NAD(P)H-dependent FMN reductase